MRHFPDGGLFVVEERPPNTARLLQFIRRRVRSRGWLSAIDALAARLVQALVHRLCVRQSEAKITPDLIVSTCNGPELSRFVAEIDARLVILNLCSVVSAAQLAAIGRPIINVHPGINPRYRGAGNVWAISEGRFDLVGATVHYVDAGIDTGPVIAYAAIDPVAMHLGVEDTFVASQRAGAALAISIANGGEPPLVPPTFKNLTSCYYPYPGLSTWLRAGFNLKRARWQRSKQIQQPRTNTVVTMALKAWIRRAISRR